MPLQDRAPGLLDRAARLLMIPDLLHHQLTQGGAGSTRSPNASTTQLVDPRTRQWEPSLLTRLGPAVPLSGRDRARQALASARRRGGVPVYAPGTHDTASAVAATPAEPGTRWAFLSSGTWSLLGVELAAPNLSREAAASGLQQRTGRRQYGPLPEKHHGPVAGAGVPPVADQRRKAASTPTPN